MMADDDRDELAAHLVDDGTISAEVERLRAREAALVAFAWQIASDHEHKWRPERCKYCDIEFSSWAAEAQYQARELLASTSAKGGGDGQR